MKNCERCKKRKPFIGTMNYPRFFSMKWGRKMTITFSRVFLCERCIEEMFDKIKDALINDEA